MRRVLGFIAATGVVVGLGTAPAAAEGTVTVPGTYFPDPRAAQLTLVGCESLYQRSHEVLLPQVSRGPGSEPGRPTAALGDRSLKYDLAGGNAIGTLSYVDSMAGTTTASLDVHAPAGATGVAYAGFQRTDAGDTSDLWIGRAPLTASASWQRVDATALTFTWAEFDMLTGEPTGETADAPATVADFGRANGGDGAGFYMVGFGCDGSPFYMDAWRVGGPGGTTTYDLDGLTTHVSMQGSGRSISKGEDVRLSGSVRDYAGRRLPHAQLVLEAKPVGAAGFETVKTVEAHTSDPAVTVSPKESTIYRWRFADRPLAYGSVSAEFRVDVIQPGQPDSPQSPSPTPPGPSEPEPSSPPSTPPSSPPSNPPSTSPPPSSPPPSSPPPPTETPAPDAPPTPTDTETTAPATEPSTPTP